MALKPVRVQDETGQPWWVYEEDVAWPYVRALHLQGIREVVLPRRTLLRGELTEVDFPATLDGMSAQSVTNVALAALLRRYVRLADCVAFLQRGRLGNPGVGSTE